MNQELSKFLVAQENDYATALSEIKSGRKKTHWMWYIFPQIAGLGQSEISKYYAIRDLDEAKTYLNHPVLGYRLKEICGELLRLPEANANKIFGYPDDLKLKSSMTLFKEAEQSAVNIFKKVLDRYFMGKPDIKTLQILNIKH